MTTNTLTHPLTEEQNETLKANLEVVDRDLQAIARELADAREHYESKLRRIEQKRLAALQSRQQRLASLLKRCKGSDVPDGARLSCCTKAATITVELPPPAPRAARRASEKAAKKTTKRRDRKRTAKKTAAKA